MSKKFYDRHRDITSYVHECRNKSCFGYGTLWNFEETIPLRKRLKGGYQQRGCPSCQSPTVLLREDAAMPFVNEDMLELEQVLAEQLILDFEPEGVNENG